MKQTDIDKLWEKYKAKIVIGGYITNHMNIEGFTKAIEEYEQVQWHSLREILIKIVDTQQKLFGDATELHLAMSSLAEEANNILQELPRWEEK